MKVAILCSTGISTSILLKKIQEEVNKETLPYEIEAYAVSEAVQAGSSCDIILLTPQVRFNLEKIKQLFPNHKIALISQTDFDNADSKEILKQINALA